MSVVVVPPVLDILLAHVPVQLPREDGALGPRAPLVQGLGGQVVVLPAAQEVPRHRIQIISVILLGIIIVVSGAIPFRFTHSLPTNNVLK